MAKSDNLKNNARFIRTKRGAIFRRTEMLEKARGSSLVSDDEARDYFEERGANLKALGLDKPSSSSKNTSSSKPTSSSESTSSSKKDDGLDKDLNAVLDD